MSKIYYPDRILNSKFENNKVMYLVKWKGYDVKDSTWESENNIGHRTDLINEYNDLVNISNINLNSVRSGYVYVRVSSKEQSKYNEGHTSLNVQKQECLKYCRENKINVIECVEEAYSARNMGKMRGLQYILGKIQSGQTIYVYDVSRFSRNIMEALNILDELLKKKATVFSVSENLDYTTIQARNQFRLQLCMANQHSDITSEKVKASLRLRKIRGDYIGSCRYGYKTETKEGIRVLVPNPEERKVIDLILSMSRENSSNKVIYKYMKDRGITLRNGKLSISGIQRIKNNHRNELKTKFKSKLASIKSGRTKKH